MKTYLVQKENGDWEDVSLPSQSIEYARGVQDGIHTMHPDSKTRIVEVLGARLISVRVCHHWKPF